MARRKCLNCKKLLPTKGQRVSKPFAFCRTADGKPKCKWDYYYAHKRKPYYQERYVSMRAQ